MVMVLGYLSMLTGGGSGGLKLRLDVRLPFESVKAHRFNVVNQGIKRAARRVDGHGVSVS